MYHILCKRFTSEECYKTELKFDYIYRSKIPLFEAQTVICVIRFSNNLIQNKHIVF